MKTLLGGSCLGALLGVVFCVVVAVVIVATNWVGFLIPPEWQFPAVLITMCVCVFAFFGYIVAWIHLDQS